MFSNNFLSKLFELYGMCVSSNPIYVPISENPYQIRVKSFVFLNRKLNLKL